MALRQLLAMVGRAGGEVTMLRGKRAADRGRGQPRSGTRSNDIWVAALVEGLPLPRDR